MNNISKCQHIVYFPSLHAFAYCNLGTGSYQLLCIFAAPLGNSTDIQVWVQAVKFEQNWTFHDGSLVPNVFLISMTNTTGEIHLRAIGTDNLTAHDARELNAFSYVC